MNRHGDVIPDVIPTVPGTKSLCVCEARGFRVSFSLGPTMCFWRGAWLGFYARHLFRSYR